MSYEYFYGIESESFSFYRVPRLLVTGEQYRQVSAEAKLLYGLLLDRMGLSARNGWYDGENRVYIYYTVEEICRDLNCGHDKAGKLLAELDSKKGIGLIERVKQGQGRPTRIYVKRFTGEAEPDCGQAGHLKNRSLESGKSEVQTSENPRSGHREIRSADIEKSDANYTDNNYTEFSYNYPSINQGEYEEKMEETKKQLDYPLLAESYPNDDPESLVELVCEVLCSSMPSIRLGGENLPMTRVRARYRRLRFEHIAYVLDSMRQSESRIHNIKAYLLRALYDAPVTIGPFYSNAVRCDCADD